MCVREAAKKVLFNGRAAPLIKTGRGKKNEKKNIRSLSSRDGTAIKKIAFFAASPANDTYFFFFQQFSRTNLIRLMII